MPRNQEEERRKIELSILNYLAPLANGEDDDRPLSLLGVSKQLKVSRMTLRKHGCDVLLRDAEARRSRVKNKAQSPKDKLLGRAQSAERERDEWRKRYDILLEKILKIEDALGSRRDIDLDGIVAGHLKKPNRDQPARLSRWSRGKL